MADKLPQKKRELQNHHMDSTIWNDLKFRDDDIIIAAYAKSGTTWLQQMIAQLLYNGAEELEVANMSPWLDLRVPPKDVKLPMVEAQTDRRFVKTHLPLDALVFSPQAKYIYLARDGRDVVWSLYNHHSKANDMWYHALNDTPGLVGPPIEKPPASVRQYFREWLEQDGYPLWSYWETIRTWWQIRALPNVMFLHFNQLKADMPAQIRRIAAYLAIDIDEATWPSILKHCSFDYMKENATKATPLGGLFWDEGAKVFINKGTNGRWRNILTAEDIAQYEQMAVDQLGADCAHWLATGEMA